MQHDAVSRPLLPRVPQPGVGDGANAPPHAPPSPSRSPAEVTSTPAATASSRPLLPLQPRLQLTTAHLTAAIAAVGAQPSTPVKRATRAAAKKPLRPTRPALVLPAPLPPGENGISSPTLSATSTSAKRNGLTPRRRSMKKCVVSFCESYARSRGLCKAHGGGKRCKHPGCEVSDQGGGFCIRHGGGKRCRVEGCEKSAQSRHYCKAHGGGARCQADGCEKSSQGGGFCRTHGGGPRRKKVVNNKGEPVESPRSRKRNKFRTQVAARVLMGAAQVIAEKEAQEEQEKAQAARDSQRVECEQGSTALSFTIRPIENPAPSMKQPEQDESGHKSTLSDGTTIATASDNPTFSQRESIEEHETHMFVAASLLGMQAATAE